MSILRSKRINILDRLDASRGELPDFLRSYWMIYWFLPWLVLLTLSFLNELTSILYFLWPIISVSMLIVRYIDIFTYKGTTFFGYPAGHKDFFRYIFWVWVPTIIGEAITYSNKH